MVNNTVYHFVGSNLGVEIFLKKREHQKTPSIGVSRKFQLHYLEKWRILEIFEPIIALHVNLRVVILVRTRRKERDV